MSIKDLAIKVLERNSQRNQSETPSFTKVKFEGEKVSIQKPMEVPYIVEDYTCPSCGKHMEAYYPKGQPYRGTCFACLNAPEKKNWQH